MQQKRADEHISNLQTKREKSANEIAEKSGELWNEVREHIKTLKSGGLEAYNEWMTGIMKIAAACSALNAAIANESIIPGIGRSIMDKTGLSALDIKGKLSDLKDKIFNTESAKLDPGLSVELFNEEGELQAPKLHATKNKDIIISDEMNNDLQSMFKDWIKVHNENYSFDSDSKQILDSSVLPGPARPLSKDELDDFKKALENKDTGFAAHVKKSMAEAGFKHDVTFYSKPEEPKAAPSIQEPVN